MNKSSSRIHNSAVVESIGQNQNPNDMFLGWWKFTVQNLVWSPMTRGSLSLPVSICISARLLTLFFLSHLHTHSCFITCDGNAVLPTVTLNSCAEHPTVALNHGVCPPTQQSCKLDCSRAEHPILLQFS